MNKLSYRRAKKQDCDEIAQLHARNWKEGYRGLCPDDYLDHEVEYDRLKVWRERFKSEDPNRHILVAEDEQHKIVAFVCTFLDDHKEYGAYLDNLHVSADFQGLGIGVILMKEAAKWVKSMRPESKLYLHVLKGNTGAIKFYQRIGGKMVGEVELTLPWGGRGMVNDYLWELDELLK